MSDTHDKMVVFNFAVPIETLDAHSTYLSELREAIGIAISTALVKRKEEADLFEGLEEDETDHMGEVLRTMNDWLYTTTCGYEPSNIQSIFDLYCKTILRTIAVPLGYTPSNQPQIMDILTHGPRRTAGLIWSIADLPELVETVCGYSNIIVEHFAPKLISGYEAG